MARDFDGTGDYISNNSFAWTGTDDMSVFWWSYVPSPDKQAFTFTIGTTNLAGDRILSHAPWDDGTLYWDYGNATAGDGRLSTSYVAYMDKWTSIGLLATSAELMKIYLDGVEVATQDFRGAPTNKTRITIGSDAIGSSSLSHKGRIAWFAVWNVGLTATEFSMLHNGMPPLALRPNSLKACYPIWGTTSPEPDWAGGNFHAAVTNTTRIDHPPRISALWLAPHPRLVQVAAAAAAGQPSMRRWGGIPHMLTGQRGRTW